MSLVEKKIIVISGVTKGLGRSLTEFYLCDGHTVIGCGRSEKAISELSQAWPNNQCFFKVVDITDEAQVQKWAQTAIERFGPPDLLINNAAVINPLAPLWQQSDQEIEKILNVNLRGVINCIRHFVPAMIKRKSGIVVNLSSGWGRSVSPKVAPYCMTKWGIEGLSRALAEELPAGMAAIPLSPGIIHTEMLETAFGSDEANQYPAAEEWAKKAAPFILSLSPRQSGESITVPGIPT